jgi:hypothetical protein
MLKLVKRVMNEYCILMVKMALDFIEKFVPRYFCTTALCLRDRDLECDAISTAPVGSSIQ